MEFLVVSNYSKYLHRRKKEKVHHLVPLPEEHQDEEGVHTADYLSDPRNNPHRDLESVTIQQHIDAALEKLTPRERSVFVLRHYNDLIPKEIGEVLNISEGTVKSLLFRAIKRMQK
jgi:RNA polymerase sigma-70 factor (ECF subfamily)